MMLKKIFNRIVDPHREDINCLLKAFPAHFHDDVRSAVSIIPFAKDTLGLARNGLSSLHYKQSNGLSLYVDRGLVEVPYRVYFEEPDAEIFEKLPESQRLIIRCIYLRHHNGFVRQKYLRQLVGINELFVCPFAIQILGEYVIQMLDDLDEIFTGPFVDACAEFLCANTFYWQQTQSRVVSYWAAYYRCQHPNFDDYIGKKLVDRMNASIKLRFEQQSFS